MLGQRHLRGRDQARQTGAIAGLLDRRKQRHHRTAPPVRVLGEQLGGTEQAGDVHVVAAGMRTGTSFPLASVAVMVLA